MKTVSIIIPIFNAENYIERCINSVINQTYSNNHIECILINDCSTDNSINKVEKILKSYQGSITFKLIQHPKNQGVAAARNTGLKNATGDYIFLIDNDDYIFSDCIETLVNAAKQYHDADLVVGNCYNHRSKSYYTNSKQNVYICNQSEIRRISYNMTYGAFPWNKLVKHDVIKKHNLYFELVSFDDLHWFIDMLQVINSMVVLSKETYSYEYIETSLSHTWEKKLNDTAKTFYHLINKAFNYNHEGSDVEHNFFIVFFLMNIYNYIDNYQVNSINNKDLNTQRNKLTRSALKERHLLVFLYDLMMYMPFRLFFYWKPIRNRSIPFRIKTANFINKINNMLPTHIL